jgi:type II secretory pathway pseudopilin PulG
MMRHINPLFFRGNDMNRSGMMQNEKAFTLIELVIVLGITGLIFGGLWGLLTSGSSQLQAQSAAQQYRQVIDATRKFLNNPPVDFVVPTDAVTIHDLPINAASPAVSLIGANYLNPNFASSCGTNLYCDAFGHQINVRYRATEISGGTPRGYIFMVYSTGTPLINDKAGAQVSSLIGAEGGFIYNSPTEGCSSMSDYTSRSCGSFGSFAFDTTGWTTAGAGHIATLSYSNDNNLTDSLWLARTDILGADFNTMRTDLLFNGAGIVMGGNNISIGAAGAATGAGSGALYMAGGNINNLGTLMGGDSTMTFGSLVLTSSNNNGISVSTGAAGGAGGPLSFTSAREVTFDVADGFTLEINGAGGAGGTLLAINGIGRADTFQAGTFIYSSDATMKDDIRPIANALDKLMKVHGVNYKWNGLPRQSIGLIAQDVEKVFPEVVSEISSGKKGIDYAKMVAPIIEAIRQLKDENEALKARIKTLENKKQAVP